MNDVDKKNKKEQGPVRPIEMSSEYSLKDRLIDFWHGLLDGLNRQKSLSEVKKTSDKGSQKRQSRTPHKRNQGANSSKSRYQQKSQSKRRSEGEGSRGSDKNRNRSVNDAKNTSSSQSKTSASRPRRRRAPLISIGHVVELKDGVDHIMIEITKGPLKSGESIHYRYAGRVFRNKIQSMTMDDKEIMEAQQGQVVGIRIKGRPRRGTRIMKRQSALNSNGDQNNSVE